MPPESIDAGPLLAAARLEAPPGARLRIAGRDPVLASRFHCGEAIATALALAGAAAAHVYRLRGGDEQEVSVDVAAAASTLLGFVFQATSAGLDLERHRNETIALYRAKDGRFVHLHGGFPHLAEGLLKLLDCSLDAQSIGRAVARQDAFALEDAIADAGVCAAAVRSPNEWAAHLQGQAVDALPAVEVSKIGESEPEPLPPGERPLEGVRVLDLTRVLAGPSCGRELASHGADVLRIGAERLPSILPFVVETGRGKRNAFLDIGRPEDAKWLRALVREADVFVQGYRQGALARRGFGPNEIAGLRPGIVYCQINCYGPLGPWAERPGWEQLAQAASGIAFREGSGDAPQLIPAAATDYTTGALAAFGVMSALARRASEGGSYLVRASLCQTAAWLQRIGSDLEPGESAGLGDVGARMQSCQTAWGELRHLAPVVKMDRTPPRWERPPSPLGSHAAQWLPREGFRGT